MNLRTTAITLGVVAALATGAAFAQPAPQSGAYDQGQGYSQQGSDRHHKHRHGHGVVALIKEEMSAGRLTHKEGTLLMQKIKQMHAEKRAEREGRGSAQPETQQPR